jgi:HEAT repeat protein
LTIFSAVDIGFFRRFLGFPVGFWALAGVMFSGCYLDTPPATPDNVANFLVDLLSDPNPDVRRTATEALGKLGMILQPDALTRTVSDPDPRVREAGAIAMGRLPGQRGIEKPLVQALEDTAVPVSRAAARSLGDLNDAEFSMDEALGRLLKDPDTNKRRAAIQALLQLERPGAFSLVAAAARDSDAEVRQGAVAALGEWWGPETFPVLRDRLLHDQAAGVRAEAAYRLGKIGEEHVVNDLNRAAESDRDEVVRRWARWASGQLTRSPGSG